MKKTLIIFSILGICSIQGYVFANEFTSLSNLTPEQSAKLTKTLSSLSASITDAQLKLNELNKKIENQ